MVRKVVLISQTFTSAGQHDGRGNALAFARTFKQRSKEQFSIYLLKDKTEGSWIIVRDFDFSNGDSQIGAQWLRCVEEEVGVLTAL
jgi:hypothetical protein